MTKPSDDKMGSVLLALEKMEREFIQKERKHLDDFLEKNKDLDVATFNLFKAAMTIQSIYAYKTGRDDVFKVMMNEVLKREGKQEGEKDVHD